MRLVRAMRPLRATLGRFAPECRRGDLNPHPLASRGPRAEGATHFLAPGKRGWPPTLSSLGRGAWGVRCDLPLFAFSGHRQLTTVLPPHAPRRGQRIGFVFCSIPPSFVLSHFTPVTNTTSNWLCFGAFLSPPVPFLRIHWPLTTATVPVPLTTILVPLATTLTPHALRQPSGVRSCADPLPRWLLPDTDHRISKRPNGARFRRAGPLSHYAPNQVIPADKSIRSFPLAAAHPLTVLSWSEALHASGSRRACLMHISRNACSLVALPDFPEFAQAVRYSVPGTQVVSPELRTLPTGGKVTGTTAIIRQVG